MTRWIVGLVAAAFGGWIMILNWIVFWRAFVRREKTSSLIPFVGAVIMAAAFLLIPVPWLHWLAWLPFLIDWGAAPAVVTAIIKSTRARREERMR
ncbi:MAG TPA: hypothetical protein VJ276_06815 [Thermoanaerobaculia bacterium]|nr:hypothetical protein [Thermoanaerobaculia bacterium]